MAQLPIFVHVDIERDIIDAIKSSAQFRQRFIEYCAMYDPSGVSLVRQALNEMGEEGNKLKRELSQTTKWLFR